MCLVYTKARRIIRETLRVVVQCHGQKKESFVSLSGQSLGELVGPRGPLMHR